MPGWQKPEDEGIMVSFGDSYTGGGSTPIADAQPLQPSQPTQPATTPPPPQPSNRPSPSTPENVMTQEDPSVAIARQEEERKKREQEEADRKAREQEEAERKRQEEERRIAEERRREEERRIAEEQRRQQEAINNANALGNAFGSSTNSQGSGTETGNDRQGNPAGKGSSGGNSWSLNGRRLVGDLAKPSYTRNVEGIITISIRVNEQGNVIGASLTTPSTISDERTINAAIDAAKKTKFSEGKSVVAGTITYNFRLN